MAFSTQGATPQTPQLPGLGGGALGGGTSQARALNTALQPNSGALKLTPTPAPTGQAIKKQTMTDTAGNTHTTEYHPPTSGMIGSSGGKPITGDTQTPSGATVNAESGQVKAPPPTYGGIIGSLAQTSQQGSPAAQGLIGASQGASQGAYGAGSAQEKEAYGKAQALNAQLSESRKNEANAEAQNRLNPIPIGDQTGREAVIRNQYLAQQNALSSELQGESNLANVGITGQGQGISGLNSAAGNANTAQGQTISGLGTAGNLAAPILGQPGQTNYGLGGNTSGGVQLSGVVGNDIGTLSSAVANGTMDYQTALSQLSGYGTAVQNQLLPAIQKLKPNFNVAQSNTLAAQQGSIGPNLQYANAAMENLKNALDALQIPGQTNASPLISGAANLFSQNTTIGAKQTKAVQDAAAEARTAIAAVLASVRGGTPTDYSGQAHTLIPDSPTQADFDAAQQTLDTLGAARQNIYSNPGTSGASQSSAGGNSLYSF